MIVETDPAFPYAQGTENGLHMSQVDHVIEGDGQPVPELPSPAHTDAERAIHRHMCGSGGQLQFVRADYASNGGTSFICMSSTYERDNMCRSRIVLNLTRGNVVAAPRSDMMFVVTEYGLVKPQRDVHSGTGEGDHLARPSGLSRRP